MGFDQNLIAGLLAKYAQHEPLSAEEEQLLEAWLAESDEHRTLAELFLDEEWVAAMQRRMRPERSAAVWETIKGRLQEEGVGLVPADEAVEVMPQAPVSEAVVQTSSRVRRMRWLWPALGGVAVVLAVVFGIYLISHRQQAPSSVVPGPAVAGPVLLDSSAVDGPVFVGPRLLRLADNSRIWLDSNARVRVPGPRRIEVEGRVYGEIAKDPTQPFVFTGQKGQRAEILGTTLVVDFETAVSVFTGEVRVSQAGQTTEVGAGEEALLGSGRLVHRRIMDTGTALAWFDRLRAFHFHNTPLATAMREVAGWYHLTILNPGNIPGVGIVYDPLPKDLPADSALAAIRKVERPYADIKKTNDSTWLITASPINP